jgi:HK97 family phage major capsid protein
MTNEEILRKADLVVSDLTSGGKLQEAQSSEFIRSLIDEATLMPMTYVKSMRAPKEEIDKIKFGSRVLRNGNEGVALSAADRAKPDLGKIELDAKHFKAETRMTYETLEDSIERGNLRQTILDLMAERVGVDMDEVLIKGDTASADTFLASFDGLLKQITSNVYNHTDTVTNKALWKAMIKLMPQPYLRNKKVLRFLTSNDSEIDYRDTLADRATVVGDKYVQEDAPAMAFGVPVVSVPLFPENIGTGSHCTSPVLIDPKNIMVGIWRDILVETERLPREGVVVAVTTLRFDMKLIEETASVKGNNVKVI